MFDCLDVYYHVRLADYINNSIEVRKLFRIFVLTQEKFIFSKINFLNINIFVNIKLLYIFFNVDFSL